MCLKYDPESGSGREAEDLRWKRNGREAKNLRFYITELKNVSRIDSKHEYLEEFDTS